MIGLATPNRILKAELNFQFSNWISFDFHCQRLWTDPILRWPPLLTTEGKLNTLTEELYTPTWRTPDLKTFQKPMNKYQYIEYTSHAPPQVNL